MPRGNSLFRRGSHFRWWLLGLLLLASFLNYFDRQALSVLKHRLQLTFFFNDADYALLINIFLAGYAVAYVVSGWVVDRLGALRSLPLFSGLWSFATLGCGLATNFSQFAVMRGLLGVAEPGVQPVTIRAAAVWAPPETRGTFMSLCVLGSSIGATVAPPAIAFLSIRYSWRLSFILPAILGFVLATLWGVTYREPSRPSHEATGAKVAVGFAIPWSRLWSTRSVWGLLLIRFITDPVWYYVLFWMFGYLQGQKGATMAQIGRVGWIPFVAANVGGVALVGFSDILARKTGSTMKSRKGTLMAVSMIAPLCILLPHTNGLLLPLVLFSLLAVVGNTWLYMLSPIIAEAFPLGNIASIWGIVGAFGALGTILFNFVVGYIPHTAKGFDALFLVLGLLYPLAALILHYSVHPFSAVEGPILSDS